MKEKMKAYGRPLRRLAALAMTCALACTLAPGLLTRARAVELSEDALTTVTYYEWKRVKTKDDLPSGSDTDKWVPLLIFDKKEKDGKTTPYYFKADSDHTVIDDEDLYYLHFNGAKCSEIPELAGFPDTFFTNNNPTGMTCWSPYLYLDEAGADFQENGDDGTIDKENADARVLYLNPSDFNLGEAGWTAPYLVDYDKYGDYLYRKHYPFYYNTLVPAYWSVITPDVYLKKYGAKDEYNEKLNVDGGRVIMELNLNGQDAVLDVNGESNKIELDFWKNRDTYWRMYIGTEITYNVINTDYTVQKGQMLNLDGDIRIGDGKTITVEEGAVLSINGNIFNNGHIYNKGGTILVQSNGCIQSYLPKDKNDYGGIGLDGGDLVIRAGGRVMTGVTNYDDRWGNGLKLQNGAAIVNQGTLITSSNISVNEDCVVENRKDGAILVGYAMKENQQGTLHHALLSEIRLPSYYDSRGFAMGVSNLYKIKRETLDDEAWKKLSDDVRNYDYFSKPTSIFNKEYQAVYKNAHSRKKLESYFTPIVCCSLDSQMGGSSLSLNERALVYNQGSICLNGSIYKAADAQILHLNGGSISYSDEAELFSKVINGDYVIKETGEVIPRSKICFK